MVEDGASEEKREERKNRGKPTRGTDGWRETGLKKTEVRKTKTVIMSMKRDKRGIEDEENQRKRQRKTKKEGLQKERLIAHITEIERGGKKTEV